LEPALTGLLIAFGGFLAGSAPFWVYLRTRAEGKDAQTRLLMGLAQDKIIHVGMKYIARGYVTADEYEDLRRYLFEPYVSLGGNGTAERIMHAVERLPLRPTSDLPNLPIRDSDLTGHEESELPDEFKS